MEIRPIPEPSLKRLPLYHSLLKEFIKENKKDVSATDIARKLDFQPIQVRKDISATGFTGKPKTGYITKELYDFLHDFLGYNTLKECFLIGCGHLGHALMSYDGFENIGLNIVAGFDIDNDKVGNKFNNKPVFHIDKLPSLIKRMKIQLVIITVSNKNAQKIAETLSDSGIKGILNFTSTRLKTNSEIIVEDVNLASNLAVLSNSIKNSI
jgi:redox-sensing transcriptional repressor